MFGIERIISISLELGLAYCLAVVGIAISFRLLAFPDLTIDGSFTLGGAVGAVLLSAGYNPALSLVVAVLAGAVAGACTASLHNRVGISKLLSGILVMTMLYSMNLRIMGRSNVSLLGKTTLLTWIESIQVLQISQVAKIAFFGMLAICMVFLVQLFLKTEFGGYLRATGENLQVVKSMGVDSRLTITIGLSISNALVAFSGFIVAQNQGFADIGMGFGMIIVGLAALIIGETLTRPASTLGLLIAALIGSILYQMFIAIGLRLGLAASDLKMATGLLVVIFLLVRQLLERIRGLEEKMPKIGSRAL